MVQLIRHLNRMMSHLKNDFTDQFLTCALSHWFINLLWENRKGFIFFCIEKLWTRVEGWCTFGWPDLVLSLTEWLPLWACYSDTSAGDSHEIGVAGEMWLDWSPWGRVIIRYDHSKTTWVCATAFVSLTAKKKCRGEKGWLKECLPSLCLWRKKYGDTRVVSKDVPWQ